MVDARTTEQRIRDREQAEKRVREDERAALALQRETQKTQELAIRASEAQSRQSVAEAEKLKREAQKIFAEALKLNEQNQKLVLERQVAVEREEYLHQKNRRTEIDRLSDVDWLEQQRHTRTYEIENIKTRLAELEMDARKFEASSAANEVQGLLSALENIPKH